jgi:hypothetical protein
MRKVSAEFSESISPLLLLAASMALALGVSASSGSRTFDLKTVSKSVESVSSGQATEMPKAIFKRWIHSHEEDTEGKKVFRPYGTSLPRSRGRMGFELKADGGFILYAIAPTDGIEAIQGKWRMTEPNVVVATLNDETIRSYSFQILSCEENLLTILEKQ